MFQRMRSAMQRFMYGRNGVDQLNIALLIAGMVFSLAWSFTNAWVIYYLTYLPLAYAVFRMFSKNLEARRRENAAFTTQLRRLKDRSHRYFRCPKCHQVVRVPKGKGRISIRCPKCSESFIKKT